MTSLEFSSRILIEKVSLKNFALSLTRNSEDALDLVQDTFLKAISYRSKFEDNTNLRAWLFTIMKNTFINGFRRNTRIKKLITKGDDAAINRAFKQISVSEAESRLNAKEIISKIKSLNKHYRIPFTFYYNGFKYEEIAVALKLPLGTIKSRIFIARKILMQELKHMRN